MQGTGRTSRTARIAQALIALALIVRLLVPAGFMPAAGQGFAITLCTGDGLTAAWIDDAGRIHEGKRGSPDGMEQPCPFAGFAAAIRLPDVLLPLMAPVAATAAFVPAPIALAIGRGLAAPPPPPTGPPAAR